MVAVFIYQPAFLTRYLGLCDVDFRREPLPRHKLKDQFTLGDRELHSTTRAREFPIFWMFSRPRGHAGA